MRTLRAGVIGGGEIAQVAHLPAYQSSDAVELAAVADLNLERRKKVADEFGIESVYESATDLLTDDSLDMVSICTPPSTHKELFVEAARQGFDVYCEKPLTTDSESARHMAAVAADNETITQVGYTLEYAENYRKVKTYVENGLLGDILSCQIYCLIPSPTTAWRYDPAVAGGGIVSDMLPHWLHYYWKLFGRKPVVDSSRIHQIHTDGVEDFAEIKLSYGETTVQAILQWTQTGLTSESIRTNILSATEGTLEFNQETLQANIRGKGVSFKHGESPLVSIGPLVQVWGQTAEELYTKPVLSFIEHVSNRNFDTTAPIGCGVEMMTMLEDIYAAGEN